GECKWTNQENGKQLTAELLHKANLLPFAKNYTVVPVLFLRNAPKDDIGNAMLPENIIDMLQ
ncbi:MAG: ATP-binding protein, partial [Firmicutes bacterium]|nr:ATP-binding protein [Bacillota bacterium]